MDGTRPKAVLGSLGNRTFRNVWNTHLAGGGEARYKAIRVDVIVKHSCKLWKCIVYADEKITEPLPTETESASPSQNRIQCFLLPTEALAKS